MCGISVILAPSGAPNLVERLGAMHAVIRHRGPDGEGFLTVDTQNKVTRTAAQAQLPLTSAQRVGLAFRRLAIRDLSPAAAQPMGNADQKLWLAFNGEIYNFKALRHELMQTGRQFRTQGDTEVVLAAYEQWAEQCFARFEGMWAMTILDLRRNRLVVSRDRFGIKPLLWTRSTEGALFFASEIKQLLTVADTAPRSNRPLIEMYLRGQRYPATEETFFASIRAVPPATWCEIDLAHITEPQFRPYWNLADFTAAQNKLSYREAVTRVEDVLARAVDSHLSADVKVGALLSGGLDSSMLVALAHRNNAPKLPTYSLGYRDAAPQFCEMRYVDPMTRQHGIENYETTLDASWVVENMDRALWALEEPPLAMPALAQFRLFEFCAMHGTKVMLDGQGADEIAAGYPYHQHRFIKERLLHRRFGEACTELRAIARREGRSAPAVFADMFVRPRFQRRPHQPWIATGGLRTNAAEFLFAGSDFGRDNALVNQQLFFDVRWGNVKIVLGYGDRNAMAHSIEARVPYFDRAFVELLFSLPDHYKIGNGDRKRILRDVARAHVPPEITERSDRMGYGTPDESIIRGPLQGHIAEALNDPAFRESGWVNAAEATRLQIDIQRGRTHDYRALWRLFALSRWARRFSVSP